MTFRGSLQFLHERLADHTSSITEAVNSPDSSFMGPRNGSLKLRATQLGNRNSPPHSAAPLNLVLLTKALHLFFHDAYVWVCQSYDGQTLTDRHEVQSFRGCKREVPV